MLAWNGNLAQDKCCGGSGKARIIDVMPIDRARITTFIRFMARRFIDDNCFQAAGALAYTTLLALVPVLTAVLGVLTAFPVFGAWREQITQFAFENFLPAAGYVVQGYFTQFVESASKATLIGIAVLLFSAISLMLSIEDAFNRIWRVPKPRAVALRLVVHWAVLLLGPLLLVTALAVSSWIAAMPLVARADESLGIRAHLLRALPFLIEFAGLTACYRWIPNCVVRLRHAAIGALVAALLFEVAKRSFTAYATDGSSYSQIYGALAIIPVFILWIYVSWLLVLLGASLAATLTAFDYRAHAPRAESGDAAV